MLALIYRMARPIPPSCFDRDKWEYELVGIIEAQRKTPHCNAFARMSVPTNWFESFWWA
jgi:hypothetical protein